MKSAIISLCIAVIILGLAVWGDSVIMDRSNRLLLICADIMDAIERDDINDVRKLSEDIHAEWEETERILSFLVHHSSLLDIEEVFVRLDFALITNDIDHLRFALSLLVNEISDIPHLETIQLETVF